MTTTIVPAACLETDCRQTKWTITGIDSATLAGLPTAVQAYSDGYRVESVMTMNTSIVGGIYGTCVVYFLNSGTMDNRNGAICHIVSVPTVTAAVPADTSADAAAAVIAATSLDINGNNLYHLPDSAWKAPSPTTTVLVSTLSNYKMTDSKYGVSSDPQPSLAAEANIMSSTITVSASWYQPQWSTNYLETRRFQRYNYVNTYAISNRVATSTVSGSVVTTTYSSGDEI